MAQVAVDGSYCSRNDMTYLCNVVLSAERSAPDAQDRVTVPFDMVTLSRRTHKDAPLKEVCSLLRDGLTCFAHGSEAEWRKKVTKGTERETYEALNVNCYSSSGIRHSLGGQAAEPQGGRLLCLRLLLSGFYITRFKVANDVGNEMGNVFREFFTEAIELLDWAHVQARVHVDLFAGVRPKPPDPIPNPTYPSPSLRHNPSAASPHFFPPGITQAIRHSTTRAQRCRSFCSKYADMRTPL